MTDACCPSSADRAELVEKWKAEREARLARGEEEEGEEEEEVNIYAVAEDHRVPLSPLLARWAWKRRSRLDSRPPVAALTGHKG